MIKVNRGGGLYFVPTNEGWKGESYQHASLDCSHERALSSGLTATVQIMYARIRRTFSTHFSTSRYAHLIFENI